MKSRITRVAATILFSVLLLSAVGIILFFKGDSRAYAAESDLTLTEITGDNVTGSVSEGYTVYIRDGDETNVTIKLKNNSGHLIEYSSIVNTTTYGEGDDAFLPIGFKRQRQNDPSIATDAQYNEVDSIVSDTVGRRDFGYDIEAGKSPTFILTVKTGDKEPGTYNWFLQFGQQHHNYEKEVYGTGRYDYYWNYAGTETDQIYSARIPIKVVIYTQSGAKLAVGENTGTDYMPVITPFTDGKIDFGTLDLESATEEQLIGSRIVTVMNDSTPNVMEDSHHNSTSIKVDFEGENTRDGKATYEGGAFSWGNDKLYDENWSPLPPKQTEGSSITFQTAWYRVTYNATDLIAGTYTGNLYVNTIPHNVKINGSAGNNSGSYKIPFRIKLTGINPRLAPAATGLTATPANGYVELEWTPNE